MALTSLIDPNVQFVHCVIPAVAVYVPAAQNAQLVALTAYWPGGQAVQNVAFPVLMYPVAHG